MRVQPAGVEAELKDPAGLWEALLPKARLPLEYELEVEYPDGTTFTSATRTRSCRRSASSTSTSRCRAVTSISTSSSARTSARSTASSGTAFAVWAPNARSVASSATSTPGTGACTRCARSARPASGSCSSPASSEGRSTSSRSGRSDGRLRLKSRPARVPHRGAAGDRLGRLARTSTSGATRSGSSARAAADPLRAPDVDLRGAPRLVAAQPARGQPSAHVPRARGRARRLRLGPRLHARRAAAGDGASVLRLVGLPGDRLLRADLALRHARRLPLLRRPPATSAASA